MKVFITGGTTGIGLALAEFYLKRGDTVGICGRALSKLPPGICEKYSKLKTYECDVLDASKLSASINDFSQGKLDLVIANAGRSMASKTQTPDFNDSKNVLEINITGVLNTFEPALTIFLEQGHGHLAAMASVAGFVGLPGAGPYSASKAAVLKLCESYSIDLHRKGISVTAICPGFIDTPLTRANEHPMPFLMPAEEGARRIVKALDKKIPLFIFPKRMKFIIMVLDKMPRFLYRFFMTLPFANYSKEH